MPKPNKITLEDLAPITQNGFTELRSEMNTRFDKVDRRFDKVEERLDRIENILLRSHDNRISKLEDEMRLLTTKLSK